MTRDPARGLRERKKLDTRRALSDAALELMFERGLDQVLREDIAARAGVSVRTFTNYFASKYEALAYRQIDRIHRGIELLRARPAGEPLWTAITEAMLEPLRVDGLDADPPPRDRQAEVRKLIASPEAQAVLTRTTADAFAEVIAERTGTDPGTLYPRLVAEAVLAALVSAIEVYPRCDPPTSITALTSQALELVAAGLPEPH
ncbi:TetR family transcriptional regulator [Nocardia sp. BSTN01]|uniref:acyl-CoA-like ligand-binding transcription factor n=1 Tax=Nocardia sp. BSTN01 TaxID=2783665 RepID=UPI0018905438|nr:TetR family transcriptional regulator [Nocardia sp. BSTN01]MBF4997193.1 TetR family transcriptional regulator [Nocardia sp. BSTN01]